MSTTHKRAGAIAALATTVMVGLPTVAAAAARGTVDYDNYSLSVIGALIFLLSAALVYFLIFKRKKMVVKPVVEEMIKTSEKDAERKASDRFPTPGLDEIGKEIAERIDEAPID